MADEDPKQAAQAREVFYIPRLKTLRLLNGWSMANLAREAGVDRAVITKIEKHHGVTEVIAHKVFNAVSGKLSPQYKDAKKEIA